MTTTRYFEVKVTGCRNCPHVDPLEQLCHFPDSATIGEAHNAYKQNKDQLTDSCPMAAQHKTEGEVLQNIRNLENDPYERI